MGGGASSGFVMRGGFRMPRTQVPDSVLTAMNFGDDAPALAQRRGVSQGGGRPEDRGEGVDAILGRRGYR